MAHKLRGFERCTLGSNHDFECDLCSQPTDLVESNGHFLAEIHQEPVSLLLSLEADSVLRPQSSVSLSNSQKRRQGERGAEIRTLTSALTLFLSVSLSTFLSSIPRHASKSFLPFFGPRTSCSSPSRRAASSPTLVVFNALAIWGRFRRPAECQASARTLSCTQR